MEGGGGLKSSDMSIEDELQIGSCDHQSEPNPECLELETAAGSHHHHPHPHPHPHPHHHQEEYLFEQMLSSLPNCSSWPDLISSSSNPSTAGGDPMDPHLLLLGRSQHVDMGGTNGSVQALFNGFPGGGTLHGNGQPTSQQPPFENFGDAMNQAPPTSVSKGGSGGGQAPERQRVRARRGQATDPHSIAERLRRERIAERMKGLQQLVPNANKTDKASMLDEIIDYVKFLQVQVKVLSMSRLGGKAGVAPLVAGLSSEGGFGVGIGPGSNRTQEAGSTNDSMLVMENQVVKLMEEDMGSAMQYLQGKGLCLMPISLATAISTATCSRTPSNGSLNNGNHQATGVNANSHPLPPLNGNGGAKGNGEGLSSPSLSVLSVQSGNLAQGDASVKDPTPSSQA